MLIVSVVILFAPSRLSAQLRSEPLAANPAARPPAPFTDAQFIPYSFLPANPADPHVGQRWYFRVFVPPSYNAANAARYPVVFFLHGLGENGTNTEKQMKDNGQYAFCEAANQAVFPCFLILPQSPGEASNRGQSAVDLIAALSQVYALDPDRMIVTGLSMGGAGTIGWLSTHPQAWAAGAPLSCYWPSNHNIPAFAQTPVWVFHSKDDGNVRYTGVDRSDALVNTLRNSGGRPIYTRFNTGGHSATSWRAAYRHPLFIRWLAQQRRGQPATQPVEVTITAPTAAPTFGTTASSANLGGTVVDHALGGRASALSATFWVNGNADFNATGNALVGSPAAWTVSAPLNLGVNRLHVVARTPSLTSLGGFTDYTDALAITRANSNSAPAVHAGADGYATLAAPLTLHATVTDDGLPSGASLNVAWTQVSGPAGAVLSTPLTPTCAVIFPQTGMYVFRLTASDTALSASDDVAVEVVETISPSGKILVDFGAVADPTNGAGWNNVTTATSGALFSALRASNGAATNVALRITQIFGGANSNGTTASGLFPASATKDNFFVQTATPGAIRLEGLDPAARYDLRLYASRLGAGVVRLTDYRAGGKTASLDVTDNINTSVTLADLQPDASGQLTLEVVKQPASAFGYISVLELAERTTDTFAAWQTRSFPAGTATAIKDAMADPDADGANNLLEYALGSDPLMAAHSALATSITADRGALQITFPALAQPDLSYVVQASSDLISWTDIATRAPFSSGWQGPAVVTQTGAGNHRTTTVRDTASLSAHPRRFLRLQLRQAP